MKPIFSILLLVAILLEPGAIQLYAEEVEGGAGKPEESGPGKPWMEAENRLSSLRTKAALFEKLLRDSIEQRKAATDRSRAVELEKEVSKNYAQLKATNEELRKQESIFRYRFPERTADPERSYKTQAVPALEQIEEQIGIEGKLNRNLAKMRSQYRNLKPGPENAGKSEPDRKPASKETQPQPPEQKNIREEDSIIIHR